MSVRPSVCPSHAGILAKRLNISSHFFHPRVATSFELFEFFLTKRYGDGDALSGMSNAGYEKIAIFDQYLAFYPVCQYAPLIRLRRMALYKVVLID